MSKLSKHRTLVRAGKRKISGVRVFQHNKYKRDMQPDAPDVLLGVGIRPSLIAYISIS